MRLRSAVTALAAVSMLAAAGPADARAGGTLTIRRAAPGPHRHGDRRTAASPNVPIPAEAGDSADGPTAHGNCSTAGGGSGNAAMASSNC